MCSNTGVMKANFGTLARRLYFTSEEAEAQRGEVASPRQSVALGLFKQQMPRPGFLLQGEFSHLGLKGGERGESAKKAQFE